MLTKFCIGVQKLMLFKTKLKSSSYITPKLREKQKTKFKKNNPKG